MIVQTSKLFEETGMVSQTYAHWLSGNQQIKQPLLGLHLLQQQLQIFEPLTIQDQVKAGLYITFNTLGQQGTQQRAAPVQILPIYEDTQVAWEVTHESKFSWHQIYISWEQLSAITSDPITQIKDFFIRRTDKQTGVSLALTRTLSQTFNDLLQGDGKQLALVGKLYSVSLQAIEQVQIQHHIQQCSECQKKLFNSQNLIEAAPLTSVEDLAEQVGLTSTALELGFIIITGMNLSEYQIEIAFRRALAQPNCGESLVSRLTADTGWTAQDIEKACFKRFGVMSHQLGRMQ